MLQIREKASRPLVVEWKLLGRPALTGYLAPLSGSITVRKTESVECFKHGKTVRPEHSMPEAGCAVPALSRRIFLLLECTLNRSPSNAGLGMSQQTEV